MRKLSFSELNYTNGGLVFDQTFVKEIILKPLAAGSLSGAVIGCVFGVSNLGRYALAYSAGSVTYKLTQSLFNEVF